MTGIQAQAIRQYLTFMREVVIRIELIAYACDGKLNLTPPYAREYSYLQFRRICELIALGCMRLHGDLAVTHTSSAKKEWHAEKIMRLLHEAHPYAFPQSIAMKRDGKKVHIKGNANTNALTRQEFKDLYAECGNILHRGSIKSIEAGDAIGTKDYDQVIAWSRKIADLMNQHAVVKVPNISFYVITLKPESGGPKCSIITKNGAGELDVHTEEM